MSKQALLVAGGRVTAWRQGGEGARVYNCLPWSMTYRGIAGAREGRGGSCEKEGEESGEMGEGDGGVWERRGVRKCQNEVGGVRWNGMVVRGGVTFFFFFFFSSRSLQLPML